MPSMAYTRIPNYPHVVIVKLFAAGANIVDDDATAPGLHAGKEGARHIDIPIDQWCKGVHNILI